MDIGSIGSSTTAVGSQVATSILSALQGLEKDVASRLFASIGVGTMIDTFA